jgi:hypothetical protein
MINEKKSDILHFGFQAFFANEFLFLFSPKDVLEKEFVRELLSLLFTQLLFLSFNILRQYFFFLFAGRPILAFLASTQLRVRFAILRASIAG